MSVVTPPRHSTGSIPSPTTRFSRDSTVFRSSLSKPKLSRQLQEAHVTLVEYKGARFLITDQPSQTNMDNFIMTCRLHDVRVLVRVCEPTYDESLLEASNIHVVDLEFRDGAPPPEDVLDAWFQLINETLQAYPTGCVAVHCRAGLGRAPALVAVALIELGLPYDEAIEMIRSRRNGALNMRQIEYLKSCRPRKRLRLKSQTDRCDIL